MRAFELIVPDKLEAASEEASKGARIKASGVDLLDLMKERVESPKALVNLLSLHKLSELSESELDQETHRIGALVTLQGLAGMNMGPTHAALTTAAGEAATPQIRNRATVGGNLLQTNRCWYYRSAAFKCEHKNGTGGCRARDGEHRYHAVMGYSDCVRVHPSNLAPALIVLGATVEIFDGKKRRQMPVADLYPKTPNAKTPENTLKPGEILTQVFVPTAGANSRTAYRESREKLSFDWATTAAAVRLVVEDGTITDAAICLGAVAPTPIIATKAAKALKGNKPGETLFRKVADLAFVDARPLVQNGYKVDVGKAILFDALQAAAGAE